MHISATSPTATTAGLELPAAILWDMDGTLIDSEPFWQAAEFDVVSAGGGTWTHEQAIALVGSDLTHASHVLSAAGAAMPPKEIEEYLVRRVSSQIRAEVPWRIHAADTLARIKALNLPCALVTMSHTPIAQAFTDVVAPNTFEVVVTGDTVEKGKPDPLPYVRAAELLGVDITRCIAVEDSPTGIASALASGARTIGIEAIVPVAAQPGLSRVKSLDQITSSVLDVIMRGGAVDFNA
jgi:HAD superfamily hydrolase (TIGR01509 family)